MSLYYPPEIKLEILKQETAPQKGFTRILRSEVKAHYPDGNVSEPFVVDSAVRDRLDAVAIIGHYCLATGDEGGKPGRYVYLRSCLRPALMFRDYAQSKRPEDEYVGNTYELPAGMVELDENGIVGLQQAAAREFQEEVGFEIEPEKMKFLGHRVFPIVSMAAERIFFLEVEVHPMNRKTPTLDGHPMEEGGIVTAVHLAEAIDLCNKGYLPDAKTELGLRRLVDKYGL